MRKFKAEYIITSGIFLCIIIGLMFSAVCVYATKKANDFINPSDEEITSNEIKIDWEALYPFESGDVKKETKRENIFERMYSHVKRKCEEYTSKRLAGYDSIVDTAKMYEETVQWNITPFYEYNGVVKLRDGYLTSYVKSVDITANAESTIELSEFCRERGIEFFYANLPTKICVSEDRNISGVLDFANQNADRFLAMLNASGVRNYDFRKLLHDDVMNHHEAFYVTDHHWKAETGLWAARHILRILRDDYGYDVNPDVLNPDRFDYVIYPEWFLGSQGKKITLERTKPDDFTMIYPKFKTLIHYEIPGKEIDTSGDFSVTYNMEAVESRDYYGKNPYGAYDYGLKAVKKFDNSSASNTNKILVMYDSFADCVTPFLALDIKHIETLNRRHFKGSIMRYIDTYNPDIVILIFNANSIGPVEFNTHTNYFDLR